MTHSPAAYSVIRHLRVLVCLPLLTCVALGGRSGRLSAQSPAVPARISFQGQVIDTAGTPLSQVLPVHFKIYQDSLTSTHLWSESQVVSFQAGVFYVLLGSVTPMPATLFSGQELYLGMAVDTEPELPRQPLVSTPYSFLSGPPQGPCPYGMTLVESFCIDKWEAYLAGQSPFVVPDSGIAATAHGVTPQGYISGTVASAACAAAGKRLCTNTEWLRACRGPGTTTYPYGNVYDNTACNDSRAVHPVIEVFGDTATWSGEELNDPRLNQLPNGLNPTGTNPQCVTAEGAFDMHGNLHEWTADPTGIFRGGFFVEASINGPGCLYVTTAHSTGYHDYSTGFRCCSDPP